MIMKKVLILLSVILLSGCVTQGIKNPEQFKPFFVVPVPGVEKEFIFAKTEEWLALSYWSSPDVIKVKNPESGVIIGRGKAYGVRNFLPTSYHYVERIEVKDGKIKYSQQDFYWSESFERVASESATDDIKKTARNRANALADYIQKQYANSAW